MASKLFCDDCLKIIKQTEDNSISCVITDPPYKIVSGGCTNKAVTYMGTKNNELKTEHYLIKIILNLKIGYHFYMIK